MNSQSLQAPRGTTVKSAATTGCLVGVALSFVYSFGFAIYAIVRSSLFIAGASDPAVLWPTLFENGITFAYLCSIFGLLLSIVSCTVGVITAIAVSWLTRGIKKRLYRVKGMLVALAAGCAFLLAGYVIVVLTFGARASLEYPETFWFWFGIPGTIYLLATIRGGALLASKLRSYDAG